VRAIAALLDSRDGLAALRRSLPRGAAPVVACRSLPGLQRALDARLVEAMVLGAVVARQPELGILQSRFPNIPVVIFGLIRSEDAEALLAWHRQGLAAIAIEGVDDSVLGELVVRQSVSARRAV